MNEIRIPLKVQNVDLRPIFNLAEVCARRDGLKLEEWIILLVIDELGKRGLLNRDPSRRELVLERIEKIANMILADRYKNKYMW